MFLSLEFQGFLGVLDWTDYVCSVEAPVSLGKLGIEKLLTLWDFGASGAWFCVGVVTFSISRFSFSLKGIHKEPSRRGYA